LKVNPIITDYTFLQSLLDDIVTKSEFVNPVDYIQETRYLPPELTKKPGFMDYDYTPYFKEPLFHLSPLSPTREVVMMKSAQIGATTALLESIIAYYMGNAPRPILYVTADNKLVEKAFMKIDKMIDSCGFRDMIKAQTSANTRRTGDKLTEKEFPGGFLHGVGAGNAGNLRSMSYPVMLIDEVDAMMTELKNEGDPISLAKNRVLVPYEDTGKVLYLSTPLIRQTSKIQKLYNEGTQKKYFVPCPKCGEMIELKWYVSSEHTETGDTGGIIYKTDEEGRLDYDSVRYKCQKCGGEFENYEKHRIVKDGEWVSQEKPKRDRIESYYINAMYSLSFSFTGMVEEWLNCYDPVKQRIFDVEKYRSFRNTKQGLPFEERGEQLTFEKVATHRRMYESGRIPNKLCEKETGNKILLLIASVDCQKSSIFVDIKGYTKDFQSYTIDFRQYSGGETSNPTALQWRDLEKLKDEIFFDDYGAKYKIQIGVIDSGAGIHTDTVYQFCRQNEIFYAIKGADTIRGNLTFRQMSRSVLQKSEKLAFEIGVSLLKTRVSSSFTMEWRPNEKQPKWYMNFPSDFSDEYFRQYEAEKMVAVKNKTTNKIQRYKWIATPGRDNHAFDTSVYNIAALEILATYTCKYELDIDGLDWDVFFELAEDGEFISK
jgi:phage terminase large subunit GpA-like protein